MRRILSLPGLAVAVWVSCLAFLGLLAGMVAVLAWHPHFLPVTAALALVIVAGLALIVGASWRIVRGPDRRRALSCLLIGAAPLWFLAGFFLYGLAVGTGRKIPLNRGDQAARSPGRVVDGPRGAVRLSAADGRREGRDDLGADARGRGPRPGRRDGPARPRPRGAAGPDDPRDHPLGARAAAGHRASRHHRPLHGEPAGRGAAGCRGPVPRPTATRSPTACSPASAPRGSIRPPLLTEGWAQANQGTDPVDQASQRPGEPRGRQRRSPSASSSGRTGTTGTSGPSTSTVRRW